MRNSGRKFAALMGSIFLRHDLDNDTFVYDTTKVGAQVLMEASSDAGQYLSYIDLSAMENGDQITFILKYPCLIDIFWSPNTSWGMTFPDGATVSGVVTIYNIDGELYV